METRDIRQVIAQNLIELRKKSGYTQTELAEKINYTDKSISKWERGEGVPDVLVMVQLADIFGVTVNEILGVEPQVIIPTKKKSKISRPVVAAMSAGLVWLVAVIVYVVLSMSLKDTSYIYLTFIYAIPVTAIVLLVFSMMSKRKILNILLSSVINWSIAVCVVLSVSFDKSWMFVLIPIPIQIIFILWYFVKIDFKKMLHIKNEQNTADAEAVQPDAQSQD